MGSSQPSEEVAVSVDGITVVKRFEEDEFPVPAIAFEFNSTRDEPVTVRLRDVVPEGIAVEDLGFHPEYGSEHWTVDDGGISFEREFEAGAEYTTVYGIRATDRQNIEQFLMEPTIEEVDPPLPDSSGAEATDVDVVPGDQEAVKEAISGDGTVPGLGEDEDGTGEGEDEETEAGEREDEETEAEALDLDDPTVETSDVDTGPSEAGEADEPEPAEAADQEVGANEDDAEAAAATDAGVPDEEESKEATGQGEEPEPAIRETGTAEPATPSVDGSLLEALAEELREDDVPDEDVELLREALGTTDTAEGSTEARIRQLQGDVADLRAYTDALDEFLDESGTARQVLEDARQQIDRFEDRLAEFGETVDRVETDAEEATTTAREAEAEVETLRDDVEDVHEEMADVRDDVEDVEEEVEDVEEEVEDVEEEVDDVQEDVDDVQEDVDGLHEDVDGVQEDIDDVQGDVDDVTEDVDEVRTGVDEVRGDVADVETDLEGASASIADLKDKTATFEEQLEELREVVHEGDLEGRIDEMESTLQDFQEWQNQIKETFGGS